MPLLKTYSPLISTLYSNEQLRYPPRLLTLLKTVSSRFVERGTAMTIMSKWIETQAIPKFKKLSGYTRKVVNKWRALQKQIPPFHPKVSLIVSTSKVKTIVAKQFFKTIITPYNSGKLFWLKDKAPEMFSPFHRLHFYIYRL